MHRILHKKAIYTLNDSSGWAKSLRWGRTCIHTQPLPPFSTKMVSLNGSTLKKYICKEKSGYQRWFREGVSAGFLYLIEKVRSQLLRKKGQSVTKCRAGQKWHFLKLCPPRWWTGWMTSLFFLLGRSDLRWYGAVNMHQVPPHLHLRFIRFSVTPG